LKAVDFRTDNAKADFLPHWGASTDPPIGKSVGGVGPSRPSDGRRSVSPNWMVSGCRNELSRWPNTLVTKAN